MTACWVALQDTLGTRDKGDRVPGQEWVGYTKVRPTSERLHDEAVGDNGLAVPTTTVIGLFPRSVSLST